MSFDVLLTANRDLPINGVLQRGVPIVAQRVETRLRTTLGDWILDQTQGLPVLDWVFQKPPNVAEIGAFVLGEIESTPGVERVENFEASFTPTTQRLLFTGGVVVEDEEDPVTITVAPFGTGSEGNTSPYIAFLTMSGPISPG